MPYDNSHKYPHSGRKAIKRARHLPGVLFRCVVFKHPDPSRWLGTVVGAGCGSLHVGLQLA